MHHDGPATNAARRSTGLPRQRGRERTHPLPLDPADPSGDSAVLAATRAFLGARTRAECAAILHTAVNDLGGGVVPARYAMNDVIPVDVSLGEGEPCLVVADPHGPAALRLAHHLGPLVEDALLAAARCDETERNAVRAAVDPLTGVASRAEIGRRLGVAEPGDAVCLLDLDGFKRLNDTQGHAAGDRALREFGRLLRLVVRATDFCGRYGGDEFLVVLAGTPLDVAYERMTRLMTSWAGRPDHGTSVSVGVALVDGRGATLAAAAADRALYRAKRLGRDRVELATAEDYEDDA
jgi:diguanylate cyclase (GGDEF)-like protein